MSILQKLTEGIQHRDVGKEGAALLSKWEKTGLLEGLGDERTKNTMAVLLENQAKELLREASSMAAGDVEGFASVAFPIVRRVFGGLIANDLVSVQPMSLPSGLIFFLDFTHNEARGGAAQNASLYGGNVVGRALTGGVDLAAGNDKSAGGFYNLGNAYSMATGSVAAAAAGTFTTLASSPISEVATTALTAAQKKHLQFDPDILGDSTLIVTVGAVKLDATFDQLNRDALGGVTMPAIDNTEKLVRRLTDVIPGTDVSGGTAAEKWLKLVFVATTAGHLNDVGGNLDHPLQIPLADNFRNVGDAHQGAIVGAAEWALEGAGVTPGLSGQISPNNIPEIDIKVDSIAVTALTKKLKAKWTPELGQDLNAYHNLDAEVELTGILSEQIALEIDREILSDLIVGATAGTRYWSRAPGLFVDSSGAELGASSAAPDFTGTVSEWYETLIETINDVSAQIHRKTLRGGANFVVCSPEVANILEFTSGFRASVTADADKGTIGAVKAGSLSKKFDVMVDPYFPRNVILIGRKGSSFLESGFVYAPYVPLQVTPTIFGQEDFVPRKGVMTRYAKKMVRPDMYGLVIVRGLLGEEGAS